MEIVSQSKPILNAPGKLTTGVYYTELNSSVENVEVNYTTGKFTQTLPSPTFGGRTQVTIPNASLLGECYLYLELPALVANQALARGWGYAAIRSITYNFGTANISQVELSGQSLLQAIMCSCQTSEKRHELFRLSGEELLDAGDVPRANILLPFPWSSPTGGLSAKKPFDTRLLTSPIIINIDFHNAAYFYGGSGTRPGAFTVAELSARMGDFANQAESLRNTLMANPQLQASYPYIHKNTINVLDVTSGGIANEVQMELKGFINSDLVAISVGLILNTDVNPVSNNSPRPHNYADLLDVRLEFNGQIMFNLKGSLYKLEACRSLVGSGFFHNSNIDPGAASPFNSEPVDSYICVFDLSRIRSTSFEQEFQNVGRFSSQVMNLFCKVPAGTYKVYGTAYYNAVASVQQGATMIHY